MATGIVRYFSDSQGFGLITPDTGGSPIFARSSAIRTPGVKKLRATQRVEFDVVEMPEGTTATNIRMLA